MKTKKVQKPFSIEEWKNGAKIETRDGRSVRIICTDVKSKAVDIVGLVEQCGYEYLMAWHADGRYWRDGEDGRDLVIVGEVEEPERWADDEDAMGEGWYFDGDSEIRSSAQEFLNDDYNRKFFATEKQAKSALAMARISQLMAHDERYGGVITDEEWMDDSSTKFAIERLENDIVTDFSYTQYYFLAFHTKEQRELFLSENEQLVKDYLMIEVLK